MEAVLESSHPGEEEEVEAQRDEDYDEDSRDSTVHAHSAIHVAYTWHA